VRSLPGALGRGNDFSALRFGDSARDVVQAVHRVEDDNGIIERADRSDVLRELELLLEARLGDVEEKPAKALFQATGVAFGIKNMRHEQLDHERLKRPELRMVAPLLGQADKRPEILVPVLPIAHELDLARRAGLHLRSILQIELPAVARFVRVLDDRDDVDA
jgi:hypothetical protein